MMDDLPRLIALDQPELDLPGVAPRTVKQRVVSWLREEEDETFGFFQATVYLQDRDALDERAERWRELRDVQAPYDQDHWLVPGGPECVWLYQEAESAFILGLFLSSLLCSHASCERVLAACLQEYEDDLDKRWPHWGLGPLAKSAHELQLIDDDLLTSLDQLTEARKVSAHFKPPVEPAAVEWRAYHAGVTRDQVLYQDALSGMSVATRLLRGDQGFKRVGWQYGGTSPKVARPLSDGDSRFVNG